MIHTRNLSFPNMNEVSRITKVDNVDEFGGIILDDLEDVRNSLLFYGGLEKVSETMMRILSRPNHPLNRVLKSGSAQVREFTEEILEDLNSFGSFFRNCSGHDHNNKNVSGTNFNNTVVYCRMIRGKYVLSLQCPEGNLDEDLARVLGKERALERSLVVAQMGSRNEGFNINFKSFLMKLGLPYYENWRYVDYFVSGGKKGISPEFVQSFRGSSFDLSIQLEASGTIYKRNGKIAGETEYRKDRTVYPLLKLSVSLPRDTIYNTTNPATSPAQISSVKRVRDFYSKKLIDPL